MKDETVLIDLLGEENLKNTCQDMAEVIRKHGLQRSSETCKILFRYMSSVVEGWNCEYNGQEA